MIVGYNTPVLTKNTTYGALSQRKVIAYHQVQLYKNFEKTVNAQRTSIFRHMKNDTFPNRQSFFYLSSFNSYWAQNDVTIGNSPLETKSYFLFKQVKEKVLKNIRFTFAL